MSEHHGLEGVEQPPAGDSRANVYLQAMRLRTLPLALASIIMGNALAADAGQFRWGVALLCTLTAVLLQILSNLANDYGDSMHGADSVTRVGPQRAVQSGLISADAMRRAIGITAVVTMVCGLLLLWLAFSGTGLAYGIIFVLLGAAAVAAAVLYTTGGRPYGYIGLGDLFVLVFFGWVAVIGSYFVQTQVLEWTILLPATAAGLLAVAVLNVNNIRDLESDRAAGKHSIPVRVGLVAARRYHWALLIGAVAITLLYTYLTYHSPWQLLYLLAVPLLLRNGLAVARTDDLSLLNPWLKQMSLATLAFAILFSAGLLIGG